MLLQPITVPFSKSTLKPSVYTLKKWGYHGNHRDTESANFYIIQKSTGP